MLCAIFRPAAVAVFLTVLSLRMCAGGVTVLEGFENGLIANSQGVTNLFPFTKFGNSRGGAPVKVSLYTAVGSGDPRVTEGAHSAKVTFPLDGFGNDLGFALSDAAAALVEAAVATNQTARFVLRYDVIFPSINQLSYFNQHFICADEWDYVRSAGAVVTNINGTRWGVATFSMPLDLLQLGLPTGPSMNSGDFNAAGMQGLTALIVDQFNGVTEPFYNYSIYLDNFRLVDTYGDPASVPVEYALQSFEDASSPPAGVTDLTGAGTSLSSYLLNGLYDPATDGGLAGVDTDPGDAFEQASDFAVTDGSRALEVVNRLANYSSSAFRVSLASGKLAEILAANPSPADLAHYTLRWDSTLPAVPATGNDGDYINLDYAATSALPMSQGRRQGRGQTGMQRATYSLTLDQVAKWAAAPALTVSFSQPPTWTPSTYFFDNFRLIDTAPPAPRITSVTYQSGAGTLTLVWTSTAGKTYTIQFAGDPGAPFTATSAANIPSAGATTSASVSLPSGRSAGFFRIQEQ
jgi:hypothetical protein